MTRTIYALAFGLYFGVIQTAYFFGLEILLTAAYTSFITATLAWISGVIAGLFLPDGRGDGGRMTNLTVAKPLIARPLMAWPLVAWHIAGLLAYYGAMVLLSSFPYDFSLLPAYWILIMISGAQAGHFFRINQPYFPTAAQLFLMENNGFIIGWISGFGGFVALGVKSLLITPAALGLTLIPMILLHARYATGQVAEPEETDSTYAS
ncbi:MAG: hypothetical protein OEZ32_08055 [Nitrospinota bacterium]|nr:hypothetical protein [Nitrospinota bacterium]